MIKQMDNEAIKPDSTPRGNRPGLSRYLLSFGIGLKDSGVKADNVMDMTAASFIPKEIQKEDAHCLCSKGFSHGSLTCLVRLEMQHV